jgi:hypothetical protein
MPAGLEISEHAMVAHHREHTHTHTDAEIAKRTTSRELSLEERTCRAADESSSLLVLSSLADRVKGWSSADEVEDWPGSEDPSPLPMPIPIPDPARRELMALIRCC